MPVTVRERKRKNGKTYLFLDIYEEGIRKQESTGLWFNRISNNIREVKKKARDLARKRENEIAQGKPIEKSKLPFIKYFESISSKKHHPYRNALNHLRVFLKKRRIENIPLKKIDEKFIREVAEYFLSVVSQNTARAMLATVKSVMNHAVRDKLISESPAKYINLKGVDTERTYLTIEEVKIMAATKSRSPSIKKAFLFACYTGLRYSDLSKLTWKDIQDGRIHFRQKKTKGFEYIPLSQAAKDILYTDIGTNVIPMPETKIFNLPYSSAACNTMKVWVRNANIKKKITFHSSRHTFATLAITQGVDIYTVSKLLGHRDLKTTEVYAKIIDSKLNDAVNRLPSI